MALRHYESGEVLFAEGSPSTTVLRIISGEAQVTKHMDGGEVLLGRLGPGEFVGEMGVILDQNRGASVRARGPVSAEEYGRGEFLERIAADSATAFQLLTRLSERLNALDKAFAKQVVNAGPRRSNGRRDTVPPPPAVEPVQGVAGLSLQAANVPLAKVLPRGGLAIEDLPFAVGRRPRRAEPPPRMKVHLILDDKTPFRLSRAHFQVEGGRGGLRIRDLGSVLGTQVNGRPIGRYFGADAAALQEGENQIVAGGDGSPFHFVLTVRD